MKRAASVCGIVLLLCMCGCTRDGMISPQERVVTVPDTEDVGLVGVWRTVTVPPGMPSDPQQSSPLTISMSDSGVYAVKSEWLNDLEISLRANVISGLAGYGIVDVEAQHGDELWRCLAVTKRDEEHLYVWWIEAKNLAQAMHAEGCSAVIEHGTFSTKVHADPGDLLECVQEHLHELTGSPTVYKEVEER